MSRLRFATAVEVFEAFPSLASLIEASPGPEAPAAFVAAELDAGRSENAVGFCAFMLPKREAVWWACRCVGALAKARSERDGACLSLAENWVRDPTDENRRAVLAAAEAGSDNSVFTWVAFAAGWSGGSIASQGPSVPPPSQATATCARLAVLNALRGLPARDRNEQVMTCVNGALSLAGLEPLRAAAR